MSRGLAEIMAELTAPGGEFALTPTRHHGVLVDAFAGSAGSLTEAFELIRGYGNREALVYADERITFDTLVATTTRLAAAMQSRYGVQPGERICIALRNYPEWVMAFWAAQLIGAVVVPLNAWSTGPELKVLLDRARPRVLFADRERLERLATVYERRVGDAVLVRVRAAAGAVESVPFADLVEHDLAVEPVRPPSGEDTATVLYTSGTTGVAKGVVGTHLNHVTALRGIQLRAAARAIANGTTADAGAARALVTFPFFHIAGLAMLSSCVVTGRPMHLMYKWDAEQALRIIEAERITELYGPPVVVRDLLTAAAGTTWDLSSLRLAASGGSVTTPDQIERVQRDFTGQVMLSNAYGLTETTGTVVSQAGQDAFHHPDALGMPIPGIQVRVVDPDGEPRAVGEDGEIQIYGPVVSPGYVDDPVATARAFHDGWFSTGDLGRIGSDGRLRLRGRLKDIIIRGGENIACPEVEQVIDGFPAVLESAVVGRPDPAMGEAVTAIVRPRSGSDLDLAALTAYARTRLAAFKVPSLFVVTVDPLPRTATGKLLKSDLARYVDPPAGEVANGDGFGC